MPGRNATLEPVLMMGSIQSDLLLGHAKKAEALVFFKITLEPVFKHFIRNTDFTSAAEVYRPHGEVVAVATGEAPPNPRFGVAFTQRGLAALHVHGVDGLDKTQPFTQGMASRAVKSFNDPDPSTWEVGQPKQELHGVFIITGEEASDVDKGLFVFANLIHGFQILKVWRGAVRPGTNEGREHFGFLDGVSQPGLRGCVDPAQTVPLTVTTSTDPDQGLPGQDLLWPGEFVFGYPAQKAPTNAVDVTDFAVKGDPQQPPLPFMVNGAFLVIRRLQQFVPEMHAGSKIEADRLKIDPQLLETQLVGRWPSGAPLLLSKTADNPALGASESENNNFEFDADREGVTCPWAAHIRKAYPRDDVRGNIAPDPTEVGREEARTQSHRMLRRGIQFGPEVTDEEKRANRTSEERGLLFKCYVTDIGDQFEFVQQAWVNNGNFVQEGAGIDPIIGQAPGAGVRPFAGAGKVGKKPTMSFKPWVKMTGGEYFFAPSIDFLRGLR